MKGRCNTITTEIRNLTDTTKRTKSLILSGMTGSECERIMETCSRFDSCSAPKCPLDILVNLRSQIDEDPKCEMAKATRHKYWLSLPEDLRSLFPFQGYLQSEFNRIESARNRWNSMSQEEKDRIRQHGMSALKGFRRSA